MATQEELVKIIEDCDPRNYHMLYDGILDNNEYSQITIPHELAIIMYEAGTGIDTMFDNSTLEVKTIQYFIDNYYYEFDFGFSEIYDKYKDNPEIFKLSYNDSLIYDIQEVIEESCEKQDITLCKLIVDNFDEIDSLTAYTLPELRRIMFEQTSHMILGDDDSIHMFGFVRPAISTNQLRDYEPCPAGWRRVLKWSSTNEELAQLEYDWNILVAHHTLANFDDLDGVESDLYWLADVWSDHNEEKFG